MNRRTMAVLAIGVGAVLAGCGGDEGNGVADLGPDEILTEAQTAVDAAESVNVTGTFPSADESAEVDLTLTQAGATGTVTQMGAEVEVLSAEGSVYMRGTADTWEAMTGDPAAGETLADKHVAIPTDNPTFAAFTGFSDLTSFADEALVPDAEITKGEETEINGQAVVGLEDSDGSTLYVATTGEPLPVQITAPEGGDGTMDLEWGVDAEITPPDQADVVDLTEMMQSG